MHGEILKPKAMNNSLKVRLLNPKKEEEEEVVVEVEEEVVEVIEVETDLKMKNVRSTLQLLVMDGSRKNKSELVHLHQSLRMLK